MSQQKGFTLIESLVAVTIIAFAVAGPLTSARTSFNAAAVSRDKMVASYLAQEAVEYIRAMRDDAYLNEYISTGGAPNSTTVWNHFISGGSSQSIAGCRAVACAFDPTNPVGVGNGKALQPCSGTCAPLRINSQDIYVLNGGTETIFTRSVQAFDVSAVDERIVAMVSWETRGQPHSVTVIDHLTPWQ